MVYYGLVHLIDTYIVEICVIHSRILVYQDLRKFVNEDYPDISKVFTEDNNKFAIENGKLVCRGQVFLIYQSTNCEEFLQYICEYITILYS